MQINKDLQAISDVCTRAVSDTPLYHPPYLLVDDIKVLVVSITDLFLQCYDFSDTLINKFPLSFHKFLPLISALVEKSRVDFPKDIKVCC